MNKLAYYFYVIHKIYTCFLKKKRIGIYKDTVEKRLSALKELGTDVGGVGIGRGNNKK